jgi:hypothetical protein
VGGTSAVQLSLVQYLIAEVQNAEAGKHYYKDYGDGIDQFLGFHISSLLLVRRPVTPHLSQ